MRSSRCVLRPLLGNAVADERERLAAGGVRAEAVLAQPVGIVGRRLVDPRALRGGVEHGARQIEAHARRARPAHRVRGQPQALRVALVAFDVARRRLTALPQAVELLLAHVAERRVAEVVQERGGLDHLGIAREAPAQPAGELDRVRQPRAEEVGLTRRDDLGLALQRAEDRLVQAARPRRAPRTAARDRARCSRRVWPTRLSSTIAVSSTSPAASDRSRTPSAGSRRRGSTSTGRV